MQVYVTENKSVDQLTDLCNTVRVFVNRDFGYGYWINEIQLLEILNLGDLSVYLPGREYLTDVPVEIAQRIVDAGATPYAKPVLV